MHKMAKVLLQALYKLPQNSSNNADNKLTLIIWPPDPERSHCAGQID